MLILKIHLHLVWKFNTKYSTIVNEVNPCAEIIKKYVTTVSRMSICIRENRSPMDFQNQYIWKQSVDWKNVILQYQVTFARGFLSSAIVPYLLLHSVFYITFSIWLCMQNFTCGCTNCKYSRGGTLYQYTNSINGHKWS